MKQKDSSASLSQDSKDHITDNEFKNDYKRELKFKAQFDQRKLFETKICDIGEKLLEDGS